MKKEMLEKVYNMQKNLIVSGDISTGKTNNVLFPLVDKMIAQNESLMILDNREEYIKKYYEILKEKNYNTIILNLKNPDQSDGWNPIQYAYELYKSGNMDKAMDYLDKIAKTIFFDKSIVDPFWSSSASDFFAGLALALFEDAKEDEINLKSISMMAIDGEMKIDNSTYIKEYFNTKNHKKPAYMNASTTIFSSNDTRLSILSFFKQKLRNYVLKEKLSMLMSKTTFNFHDISVNPTAIFVISNEETKILNGLVSIFIEQLFSVIYDMNLHNKFNFVLDNFDTIEHLNGFTDMLGSGLARNIKFIVSTRSLEYLLNKYTSYVKNLSNQIYVNNDSVKILMNDKEEIVENTYEYTDVICEEIEYPKLESRPVKLFNLREYVLLQKGQSFFPEISTDEKVDVDSMVKRIDAKIAKLEEEDRLEKEKNKNKDIDTLIGNLDSVIAKLEEEERLEKESKQ